MPLGWLKRIAYSLAYRHLRYFITVFGSCSNLWQTKVDSVLKGVLKKNIWHNFNSSHLGISETMSMPNFRSFFFFGNSGDQSLQF